MGASESDLLNAFSNVKKIDGDGSINLVKAAEAAGVQQFLMVTSLGTGKFGWPAGKAWTNQTSPMEVVMKVPS